MIEGKVWSSLKPTCNGIYLLRGEELKRDWAVLVKITPQGDVMVDVSGFTPDAAHGNWFPLLTLGKNLEWCGPFVEKVQPMRSFIDLPYGARFKFPGSDDVWVRTQYNVIARWHSLNSPARQELCCFFRDGSTNPMEQKDTKVNVVE